MVVVSEWAALSFRHIVRRNFWVYRKFLVNRLVWNLIAPTLTLLAFGLGVGSFIEEIEGLSYITFIAPGLIAFTTAFAAAADTTYGSFIRMKFQSTFDAQLATPLSIRDLVLGEVIYSTFAAEIAAFGMLTISFFLGAPLSTSAIFTPLIVFFIGFTFSSLGILACAYAPKIESFTYFFEGFLIPVQFLSGAYFPITILPDLLKNIALFIPLTSAVTVTRNLFIGSWDWSIFLWMLIINIITAGIALILAMRKLHRRLQT